MRERAQTCVAARPYGSAGEPYCSAGEPCGGKSDIPHSKAGRRQPTSLINSMSHMWRRMAAATIPRSSGSHRRKRNYVPVVWRLTQQSPEVNKCRAIVVLEREWDHRIRGGC